MSALGPPLLYLLSAGLVLLAVRRWLLPMTPWAGLALLLLPAIFTGEALLTGRVYAPMDMVLETSPADAAAEELGLETSDAPRIAGDIPFQIVPWHHAVRQAWAAGDWPLWNPDLLAGDVLAAAAQPAPWHPVNLLALLLPLDLSLSFLASLFVFAAGTGAFVFARDLGCRELAALVAAAAWGWSSFVVFWLLWPLGLTVAGFLWVLAAVRRLSRQPSVGNTLFLGATFLWILLAGHPESVLHIVAAGAVYGLFELASHALAAPDAATCRRRVLRAVGGALVAGLLALSAAAVFLLPHLEALPQTEQYEGRRLHFAQEDHSIPLRHAFGRLRASLVPFVHGVPWEPEGAAEGAPFFVPPSSAYLGSVLFVPILFGLWRHPWRGRWLLAAFAAVGTLAGASFPGVTHALAALPLFELGIHKRWVFVGAGSLALLAALGAEAWARDVERGTSRSTRRPVLGLLAAVVAVLVGLLLRSWPGMLRTGLEPDFLLPRTVVFFALTLAAGLALAFAPRLRRVSRPAAGLGLLLLILAVQRAHEAGDRYPALERQAVYPRPAILDRLPESPEPSRIVAVGDLLPPNLAGVYGLADVRGYEPMALRRFVETYPLWAERQVYFNRVTDLERPFLSFLGVRHALAPATTDPPPGWRGLAAEGDVRWLENERALPLAFLPAVVHLDPSFPELRRGMATATDFGAEAWIRRARPGPATTETNAAGRVEVRAEGTGYRLEVDLAEPGWIVTSIPDWKGWRVVEMDGDLRREQPTATANHAFVAFRSDSGRRTFLVRYLPRSFVLGGALSLTTLVATALFLAWSSRRRGATYSP